ncbi:MAG: type II CRISPR RNA-guided endonuclease Cas9, partial [Burkholderiaceae bacterium]|nr:type II CRISPR RNA-guided endonuclease Cas9 [Burkholderiaceae bacterium]
MVHRLRNNLGPLTFGFDIGIASVGWCVIVEINRKLYILDLGARCFDKAETAKEGESLNLARRTARLMRRRLRRRAWRLTKLARLLKREGLIADAKAIQQPPEKSPWHLRVEGLDKLLTPTEWAHVLYHLCKHRGFHWVSKAQEKKAESDKGEGGQVTQALKDAELRRKEKGYRSEAERILTDFPSAQRNKQGEYKKALKRVWLGEELELLFKRQRGFGNPHASPEFETRIVGNGDRKTGLFWEQQPALSGTKLMEMVGNCTFEKDGPTLYTPDQILTQFLASTIRRAPKASYSAERHVWLTRLNNLRIVVDGNARPLTEAERQIALPLPYQQAGDFKYEQLKKALVKAGLMPESAKFAGLNYSQKNKDGTDKDPESERLVKLPAWQEIRKTLKDAGLETEWQGIASQP